MSEESFRPEGFPYPNVWMTFEAPDENGQLAKYRIQDLPPERCKDAIKHMIANFVLEEAFCRARNMADDEASIEDFTSIWREVIYEDEMSLVCFKEGSDEIIGLNLLSVEEKEELADEDWEEYESENVKDMERVVEYMTDESNLFEHYQVDRYLSGCGMSVLPKYRRRGIGLKLLEAGKLLAKVCDLKLRSDLFSSGESQRLAEKAGFEKNFEITFEELAKKNASYSFNVSGEATLAVYSMRIP